MLNRKRIIIFLFAYLLWRVFSFYFGPATPLHDPSLLNSLAGLAYAIAITYLLIKKNPWGWYLVALEIILGGAGSFVGIGSTSLRTILLVVSMGIYGIQKIKNDELKSILQKNKATAYRLSLLIGFAALAALIGYLNNHDQHLIIADLIPYAFFLYYFPLKELLAKQEFKSLALDALFAAILGNVIIIAHTFLTFTSGFHVLQDTYYHWYRDVAAGKITELPFHFYRLVLNEQLLLVPVLLWFLSRLVILSETKDLSVDDLDSSRHHDSVGTQNDKPKKNIAYRLSPIILLVILAINLTRIYLLAIAIGYLFLFTKTNWKRWLTVGLLSLIAFIALFIVIHFTASRGQSLGLELFGLKLQSITTPQIEDSSLSRLLLFPKIIEKIKAQPLLGNGLGDTVTVYSPIFKQTISTPHFDWGYLEIMNELGLVGLLIWLSLIAYLANPRLRRGEGRERSRWHLASLAALLVTNVTSPALFHVLGIICLTYLLAESQITRV